MVTEGWKRSRINKMWFVSNLGRISTSIGGPILVQKSLEDGRLYCWSRTEGRYYSVEDIFKNEFPHIDYHKNTDRERYSLKGPSGGRVYSPELNRTFRNAAEAARYLGVSESSTSRVLHGTLHTCAGVHLRYI